MLDDWSNSVAKFVKVMPRDYKKMLNAFELVRNEGVKNEDDVQLEAFKRFA